MIVIVCLDSKGGMAFNKRRQSRDKKLLERVITKISDHTLWLNSYSAELFSSFKDPGIKVESDFLFKAAVGDFCFVEDQRLLDFEDKIEEIVVYKWNRLYPADLYFDIPLSEHGWILQSALEFPGYSHETITEEIYRK